MIPERFDLVPPKALRECAKVMAKGAERYGEQNWRGLPASNAANHAIRHLIMWLSGDRSEPHAIHAACNCLMLAELEEAER